MNQLLSLFAYVAALLVSLSIDTFLGRSCLYALFLCAVVGITALLIHRKYRERRADCRADRLQMQLFAAHVYHQSVSDKARTLNLVGMHTDARLIRKRLPAELVLFEFPDLMNDEMLFGKRLSGVLGCVVDGRYYVPRVKGGLRK